MVITWLALKRGRGLSLYNVSIESPVGKIKNGAHLILRRTSEKRYGSA
jgi:hypothetical protein